MLSAAALAGCSADPEPTAISTPTPTPTPTPSPSPSLTPAPTVSWRNLDPRLTATLKRGAVTGTVDKVYPNAFGSTQIRQTLLLTTLGTADQPWIAVSLIGETNQVQIFAGDAKKPSYLPKLPAGIDGEALSMAWDPKTRQLFLTVAGHLLAWSRESPTAFIDLGQVPGASTVYRLTIDPRGYLWGGTYPLGAVFNFHIASKKITVFDQLAKDTHYARRLELDDHGRLWIGTGSLNPRLFMLHVDKPHQVKEIQIPDPIHNGFIGEIRVRGNRLFATVSERSEHLVLNTETLDWLTPSAKFTAAQSPTLGLSSGYNPKSGTYYFIDEDRVFSNTKNHKRTLAPVTVKEPLDIHVYGKNVFILGQSAHGFSLQRIDSTSPRGRTSAVNRRVSPSALAIQSIMGHPDGNVYLGGYMGLGISAVDPKTSARWHSPAGGSLIHQIENMISFDEQRTYIGSYGSADLISWNASAKDQNKSYRRLARLSTEYHQSRPFGWAKNSSRVFVGTVPDYGRSGGVLGCIDPAADKLLWVDDGGGEGFIRHHSIVGLAAAENYLYGTTSVRNGYGIPDTDGEAWAFKYDISARKLIWKTHAVPGADALYAPMLLAGWLLAADNEGVKVIDPRDGTLAASHKVSGKSNDQYRAGWYSADIELIPGTRLLAHSSRGVMSILDFGVGSAHRMRPVRQETKYGVRLTTLPDGQFFGVVNGTDLVKLDPSPPKPGPS